MYIYVRVYAKEMNLDTEMNVSKNVQKLIILSGIIISAKKSVTKMQMVNIIIQLMRLREILLVITLYINAFHHAVKQ